ncbi:MAG: amidohydrolase [Clostridia bacterium]|nr:amidohydrolase [Clostridia bacterium]
MNYRFYNAKILLRNEIVDGELCVENSKISYIGQSKVSNIKFDEEIDLKGKLIMSGLINMHSHTSMSWARNLSNDTNLEDWLYNNIFPVEENMEPDDFYWTTLQGIKELVRNGITTCLDMYIDNRNTYRAFSKANYRAMLSIFPKEIDLIEQNKNDLISFCMQIHSVYNVTETDIVDAIKLARKYKLKINMHLSESLSEMGECFAKNSCTPTQYLDSFGVFDEPCICAHCVHLEDKDYEILSSKGATAVINNSANLKLGSGVAPAYTIMKRGINVCIGTDGAGSNNHIDMFKEMFLTSTLSKGIMHDPCAITNNEVLDMASKNASKALGMDKIGELKVGNFADLIVLDINEPNYQPLSKLNNGLIYCANSKDVVMTMVNGKFLYREGHYYLGEDENIITHEFNKIVNRLVK